MGLHHSWTALKNVALFLFIYWLTKNKVRKKLQIKQKQKYLDIIDRNYLDIYGLFICKIVIKGNPVH